jgi:hypothetical protein
MKNGNNTIAAPGEDPKKKPAATTPAKPAAAKRTRSKAEASGVTPAAKVTGAAKAAPADAPAAKKPRTRAKKKAVVANAPLYRPLHPVEVRFAPDTVSGAPGELRMVPIALMRVDDAYQRVISGKSHRVIREICEHFDWRKFLPMILVARPDGMYDIIDGQHRATAALSLKEAGRTDMDELPSYVIEATQAEAAGAFAAINGSVTQVSPADVWFAQITAKDPAALKLKAVLDKIGITIVRHSSVAGVAETASIAVLRRAWNRYDADVFEIILHAIVHTGDGNPGMIMGATVNGIGFAIEKKPHLHKDPRPLFRVMNQVKIRDMVTDARIESARTGNPIQFILTREINTMLRKA